MVCRYIRKSSLQSYHETLTIHALQCQLPTAWLPSFTYSIQRLELHQPTSIYCNCACASSHDAHHTDMCRPNLQHPDDVSTACTHELLHKVVAGHAWHALCKYVEQCILQTGGDPFSGPRRFYSWHETQNTSAQHQRATLSPSGKHNSSLAKSNRRRVPGKSFIHVVDLPLSIHQQHASKQASAFIYHCLLIVDKNVTGGQNAAVAAASLKIAAGHGQQSAASHQRLCKQQRLQHLSMAQPSACHKQQMVQHSGGGR